ncbi:hypothetical protein EJ04DRAFT_492377 [Polyplosphaeria fusca]|uniref:Ring-like domain-containing protein n=1 Tax=Polyplosphaeria fusca TaxID=682080 RepID=A0A9P4R102_9PLEO|nr:hypothetical protein EJ04DRAFT_492377 [Polyplosphaeria fusca]
MSLSLFDIKKFRRQSQQKVSATSSSAEAAPATVTSPHEEPAASPVLDKEDEQFFERLAAIAREPEGTPPPLPSRPATTQNGAEGKSDIDVQREELAAGVPLPMSPPPEVTVEDAEPEDKKGKGKAKAEEGLGRRKSVMGYWKLAQSRLGRTSEKDGDKTKEPKDKKKEKASAKEKEKLAKDLHAAAESAKASEDQETQKEEQDLTAILDQLNLSAVNNRVFSFSEESQELLEKFKLVLKDLVNGVPTAYNDLEKLLTDSESQLKKMFGNLPPFLQSLVKSLPTKISAALAPELMAASAEKPGFDAQQRMGTASAGIKSKKPKIPSLKSLVTAEGAVATMLKSILNFLKLRFPAVLTGTNVLLSLAVFILLFVFWYCHKRGREVRLEGERLAAEGDSALTSSASSFDDDGDSLVEEKQKGESSKRTEKEKPEPPLIIHDDKEEEGRPSATVEDMPSVSHLPEPSSVPVPESNGPTPMKEKEAPLEAKGK